MQSTFEWLIRNKEWLFSGIGLFILIAISQRRTDIMRAIRKTFGRPVLTEQVKLLFQNESVRVSRPDEGVATFDLWLVNLSTKSIIVDRFVLDSWSWLSHQLPELVPAVRGLGVAVPKQSIGYVHLSIQLNTAAIRCITETAPKDPRQFIQGSLSLYISGYFNLKEARHPINYQLEARIPQCWFYWFQQETERPTPS
jgi:hypothetical protein